LTNQIHISTVESGVACAEPPETAPSSV